jgi:hypothetical protein
VILESFHLGFPEHGIAIRLVKKRKSFLLIRLQQLPEGSFVVSRRGKEGYDELYLIAFEYSTIPSLSS